MDSFLNINNVVRIFSFSVVFIIHIFVFGKVSSDSASWILLIILFFWNLLFIFVRKNSNVILVSVLGDIILGPAFVFISKNPFGILLSFMVPSVTAIQFFDNYYRYVIIILSIVSTIIGLAGISALISDPFFSYVLSFLAASITVSLLIIIVFYVLKGIIYSFNQQFETYKEQNEFLVSNINELENEIYQYETQIENLKNEIEQERIAFNIEMEKIVKEFQNRKDETYNQLKALNNELIIKDKTIQELNQNINNLIQEIQEYKNRVMYIRNMLNFFSENIDDFQSLYKISEDIVNLVSNFIEYDTLVIFLKNELENKVDAFIVAGENSEFYYNYKKIEVEDMYKYTFLEGRVSIAYKRDESLLRPFYPKEQVALAIPIEAAGKRIGLMYISYLDENKYKDFDEEFLMDITRIIGIMLYVSIFYSKSINRVIWDDRLFCYSPEFIWEFINNLVFSSKRYKEYFAISFISFAHTFGKNINDLSEEDFKFIREINIAIKSVIRETDMISFIGNGVVAVVLSKVDKDKVDIVCKRIKNIIDSKLNFLGYQGECYMVCSVYPYKDLEIQELIDLSMEKLSKNLKNKRVIIEMIA